MVVLLHRLLAETVELHLGSFASSLFVMSESLVGNVYHIYQAKMAGLFT